MSLDTPLLNTQEVVERTIFHSIRKQCVAKGYTPDIDDYPVTNEGYRAYMAAFKSISDSKGFAIEIFNAGPPSERELKQVPRIVLDSQGFLPGSIGGDHSQQYNKTEAGDKYYSYLQPPSTSDFYFNIWLVSGTVTQNRILNSLLSLAVPRRGYIPIYTEPSYPLFVRYLSFVDSTGIPTSGVMEQIARYVCPDLVEVNDNIVVPEISPLLELDLDIDINDGETHNINIQ